MLNRALIPMILLKDTAKQIVNNEPLSGEQLEVGINKGDVNPGAYSILDLYQKATARSGTHILYHYNEVPIYIHVLYGNNQLFKHMDKVFYGYESFNIPNPFDKYLETL